MATMTAETMVEGRNPPPRPSRVRNKASEIIVVFLGFACAHPGKYLNKAAAYPRPILARLSSSRPYSRRSMATTVAEKTIVGSGKASESRGGGQRLVK